MHCKPRKKREENGQLRNSAALPRAITFARSGQVVERAPDRLQAVETRKTLSLALSGNVLRVASVHPTTAFARTKRALRIPH